MTLNVLLVNDDGPPHSQSPFFEPFFNAIVEKTDWNIVVALPNIHRSWASKFINVSDDIQLVEYPYKNAKSGRDIRLYLIDGPPASVTNAAILNLFEGKACDLVISGPNYGRNSGRLFALSSGTLGAALEACTLDCKAIALSFAVKKEDDHDIYDDSSVQKCCHESIKVIKYLQTNWPKDVELYSVNFPIKEDYSDTIIRYCGIMSQTWKDGFKMVSDSGEKDYTDFPETFLGQQRHDTPHKILTFRKVNYPALFERIRAEGQEKDDAFCVEKEFITVTPMQANFLQMNLQEDDIKLSDIDA